MTLALASDRRIRRTRNAIFDAFRGLVLSRRYDDIRTGDIIAAADIGRSTFYEHFRSKDDVLLTSMEPLLTPLADAAAGRADPAHVRFVLEHFWEQRGLARVIFDSGLYDRLVRKLAGMIEARMSGSPAGAPPARLLAQGAAAAQFAMIRSWLAGEAPCPPAILAETLIARSGGAICGAPGKEPA